MGESPASEAAPTASTRSPARRGCGVRDSGFRIRLLKWLKLIGVIKQRLFYATGAVNLRRVNLRSSVNRLTTRESSSHQTPPFHHPFPQFLDFSDNRSKSARLRAICDSAWTRRAAPAALIRRKWQNLSGLDSSGSTDVRSHFAFIDRIQTKGHTRASVARPSQFSDVSENRSKFARLRAICDCAWTRRAAPAALIRRKWQNLSGLDSSGSTDVRSHFAFIDRIQTKGHTRASVARPSQFSDVSENRSKFARLRAICDCAWTRRAAPAALIRRKWQNLSGLDSSGSTDVRSTSHSSIESKLRGTHEQASHHR